MKKVLENFCNNKNINKGLMLIDMPTGIGKTFSVAEYIANNYEKISGKIFFVTQLKKNLPEDDIKKCFKKLGIEDKIDEVLLRVENNVDNLCVNFHSVKNELYTHIGDNLLLSKIEREINLINGNKDIREENMFLIQQARDDLQNELERELRNKVTAYLAFDETGKERTKAQKKYLLDTDEKFQWISKLYPTTQTYKKKIFIMSLDKFLYKYSTIIEPPFNLYESDLLENSVIFMDEFDGTKDVILRKIINDGLANQFGILELFREIYVGLFNPDFTKLLTEESKYNKEVNEKKKTRHLKSPMEILEGFQVRAKKLYDDYKFVFQFKVHEDSKDGVKFLFQDYKTHTVVDGKKKRLRLEVDTEKSVNWIKVESIGNKSNFVEDENNEDDVGNINKTIYSLINELQRFLRDYQTGIGFIADNYYHLKIERGAEKYNINRESAIRTVLAEFGLDGRYQNYLTLNILSHAKRNNFDWRQLSDIIDASVYENGFRYYHLVDNDNHDTMSKMNYVAFNDSPEKFLCRLINRTKIVGISATATLPSSLGNYDLNYLRSKCKNMIVELTEADKIRLNEHYRLFVKYYDRVNIESKPFGVSGNLSKSAQKDYDECSCRLDEGATNEKKYLKQRLLCFAEAVEFFLDGKNKEIKSFLYFANSKGREFYVDGSNLLFELFRKLQSHYSKQAKLMFLYGNIDEFEKRKTEIQDLLKNGENVFVVTTYATMGAGQNIHYEYDFSFKPSVQVNDLDYNLTKKDFDAIYLEKPTHVIVNNHTRINTDEDFIKYIYQIKFLQEAGDYLPYEILSKVREAFKNRESGGGHDCIPTRHTASFLLAYAKIIQQAIGRICRTANKNKNIYVFYEKGLEEFIAPIVDYYNDKLINPEFKAFIDSCKRIYANLEVSDNSLSLQRLAETKDERSYHYKESIRGKWNKERIDHWERIREEVLRKPTINSLNETEYSELYIELPQADNKYYIYDRNYNDTSNDKLPKYSFEKNWDINV